MADRPSPIAEIIVTAEGKLLAGDRIFACTLGKTGLQTMKREGDGATPTGRFHLRRCLYRPDREAPPQTLLPLTPLSSLMGWCDDPSHAEYNRLVTLPFAARHEALWCDDHGYDLIVVIGHNDDPPLPGKGSAVFLHLTHDDGRPTAGCVALSKEDMRLLLPMLSAQTEIVIGEATPSPSGRRLG